MENQSDVEYDILQVMFKKERKTVFIPECNLSPYLFDHPTLYFWTVDLEFGFHTEAESDLNKVIALFWGEV